MKQLLMTTLLIMTVVLIYIQVVQGENGTGGVIADSGSGMANHISRMSPP